MVPFQPLFFHGRPNGDFSPPPHRPLRDSVPTSFSLIWLRLIITIRFCFRYVLYSCLALKHPCGLLWSALLETVINLQLFPTALLFPPTVSGNGSCKPFPPTVSDNGSCKPFPPTVSDNGSLGNILQPKISGTVLRFQPLS